MTNEQIDIYDAYAKVIERNKKIIFELKWGRLCTDEIPLIIKGLELVEIMLRENLELRKAISETKLQEENTY
jgi:hypothetical protein